MRENQAKQGKEIAEHLSEVNMDPWHYIYENYIRDYSKKSTQEEKPTDNLSSTTHESNKDKNKHDDNNVIDKKIDVHEYEQKCWKILDDDEIRFAGLLDEFGTILAGGYKQGINSRLTEEQQQSVCEELASRVTKRKKFDKELGLVRYSASRREHVVIMSFPIYEKVIMVVAEPNINIDRFSFRILNKLGRQWSDVT
jgi:hypothetical protein